MSKTNRNFERQPPSKGSFQAHQHRGQRGNHDPHPERRDRDQPQPKGYHHFAQRREHGDGKDVMHSYGKEKMPTNNGNAKTFPSTQTHCEEQWVQVPYRKSRDRGRLDPHAHSVQHYQGDRGGHGGEPTHRYGREKTRTGKGNSGKFIPLESCRTVEETTQLAFNHIETLSSGGVAAVWSRISRLLPTYLDSSSRNLNQHRLKAQLDALVNCTTKSVGNYSPRELSETIFGLGKIVQNTRKCRNNDGPFHDLLTAKGTIFKSIATATSLLLQRKHKFSARELSTISYAYAIAEVYDESKLFGHIAVTAISILDDFNPQDLSNIVWAFATTKEQSHLLFEKVATHVVKCNLSSFKPQTLSNIVWAFATVNETSHHLFQRVAIHITKCNLASFKPQEFSNIAWAFATANEPSHHLFKRVANHVTKCNLASFTPQALSNIVWAFATANETSHHLFERVAIHIMECSLSSFKPQTLSNIVWAFATANEPSHHLFKRVANHVTKCNLASFTPQTLSNIVWAFATANEPSHHLFKRVASHIMDCNLSSFKPQNFSNILWAFATTNKPSHRLFETFANHIMACNLSSFKPQTLSNIVWAFATANETNHYLFERVANHIAECNLTSFKPQDFSNIVWAFATVNEPSNHLFEKVAIHIAKCNLSSFKPQDLSNIAWSHAVLNADAPSLFCNNPNFVYSFFTSMDNFGNRDLCRLYQWHLWQQESNKPNSGLHPILLERCRSSFITSGYHISVLQKDVAAVLSSIGLNPKEEVLLQSGYSLDLLVNIHGKNIGVEVDGPTHFLGQSRDPTGSTLLKRRQIANLDKMCIVSVPYWEWDELGRDRSKKQRYLRECLGM